MSQLEKNSMYKDSGVEWIGEIPRNWEKVKLSRLFAEIGSGGTPSSTNENYYVDGSIKWINTGDLNDGYLNDTKNKVTEQALNEVSTLKLYPKNSLIVAMYGATIGKLAITNIEGVTNQACCVLATPIKTRIKFMFYWFLTNREDIINSASGGGQPNISQSLIKSLSVFLPDSLVEQDNIIKYLDNKTSQIDSLISDKERLIELLEEKRQSIITETVTKGLDPNVKMEDSKIEWIGEIPEDWKTTKIKYTTYVKGRIGWQGLRSDEFIEVGPHLVTGTDFKDGLVNWSNCHRISEERYEEAPQIQLKNNDVLITKDGTIGKIAIVKNKPSKAILNSGVFVTRPIRGEYLTEYIYWILKSDIFINYIDVMSSGTTVRHLYQETFNNFIYPLPNLKDQKEISEVILERTDSLTALITDLRLQISKLKEYRESIIYEVVTGKIDVRDFVAEM